MFWCYGVNIIVAKTKLCLFTHDGRRGDE